MKAWEQNIRSVTPYTPGEQPRHPGMIKLNTNENPYPPAPGVARVLREFDTDRLRLYPDPAMKELTDAIAAYHGIQKDMVFAGVGSDDVLAMCFMTFFNGKKPILFPDVTYSFYDVWAELFRIPYERPPLDGEFQVVKEDYYRENGGVVLPNPNAPTALYAPLAEIEEILKHNQDVIVILDEAYIDFGGASALELLDRYENLVVVRTYSKSRSMAGMRIGYAMAAPALIKALNAVKYSFNSYTLNQVAIAAGKAALEDEPYFRQTLEKILKTRDWTEKELSRLGFVYPKSSANFIFASHPMFQAQELQEMLRDQKIFVRYFHAPRVDNHLRITIGIQKEMERLIEILEAYIEEKG